jgi:hypothetical protein
MGKRYNDIAVVEVKTIGNNPFTDPGRVFYCGFIEKHDDQGMTLRFQNADYGLTTLRVYLRNAQIESISRIGEVPMICTEKKAIKTK